MKYFFFLCCSLVLLSCGNNQKKEPKAETIDGEMLFKTNCASCHKPMEDFTGPALYGANERWKDKQLLYEFVRDPQSVIRKDGYAMSIYEKWNKAIMLPSPDLTDEEIDAILSYCNKEK